MDHLFQSDHDSYRTEAFFATSAAYQVLGAARKHVPADTALRAVQAGWITDPNERGPADRPLLLAYLGTFGAPAHGSPDQPVTWMDEHHRWWCMSTAKPVTPSYGTPVVLPAELDDPVGPALPARAVQVALELLQRGALPWLQDASGRDSLDQAFSLGWTVLWQRLLDRPDAPGLDVLAQRTLYVPFIKASGGSSTGTDLPWLHAACAFGRDHALERLLDHGMDVNQRDSSGRTPLFYAQLPSTVERLLDRGADPMAQDLDGQQASTGWTRTVAQSGHLGAMNRVLQARLTPLFEADPEALRAMNRPTLYDLAQTGTKDNVLRFMRANGFSADDRQPNGVSLLARAAMGVLLDPSRQPALVQHLLERVSDPWHESRTGVPDLLLVWLAGQTSDLPLARGLRGTVMRTLATRYDLDKPQGYEGYAGLMTDVLGAIDTLVEHQPGLAPKVGRGLAHGLYRSMRGETIPATKLEKSRQESFAPDGWATSPMADGTSCGWTVCARAVHLGAPTGAYDSMGDIFSAAMRSLMEEDFKHTVERPRVPYDAAAFHALLVPLGDHRAGGRAAGFRPDSVMHQMFKFCVRQGLDLDPARPGFETALERIRLNNPPIAQAVEEAALRKGLEEVLRETPTTAPRTRRRM